MTMENTIIYLIGFAGTGKLTIAGEITKITGAKLVDNHLINNPVFSLIQQDGVTPLPDAVWDKTWAIRRIVLDVIRNISPVDYSFVFTNELIEGSAEDARLFEEVAGLARARKAAFHTVRLICEEEELCRRVASEDRRKNFKERDVDAARHKSRHEKVFQPLHSDVFTLDVSRLSPGEAAKAIIERR
jgi:hypothetical protein